MLTFYYHPLSPIARRVWLALLEKAIPFEPVLVDLKARENLQSHYLALNPFHHVPVVVDGDTQILESFAILDYLEAKFPEPPLSSRDPIAISQMKMVQQVTANELFPQLPHLVTAAPETMGPTDLPHVHTVLTFFTAQLGAATYFGGDHLDLADITAGAVIPLMVQLGFSLRDYPELAAWCDRLTVRPAWQHTTPTNSDLEAWRRWIALMIKRKQRQLAQW
jgi:glutathione S-transferase